MSKTTEQDPATPAWSAHAGLKAAAVTLFKIAKPVRSNL